LFALGGGERRWEIGGGSSGLVQEWKVCLWLKSWSGADGVERNLRESGNQRLGGREDRFSWAAWMESGFKDDYTPTSRI